MRALTQVLVILALGLAVSGCDKCGDWYWGRTQKVCHDDGSVK